MKDSKPPVAGGSPADHLREKTCKKCGETYVVRDGHTCWV